MTLKSGHCLTRHHTSCTWPRCTCTCGHEGRVTTADDVREMVAQTFDEGAGNASEFARITGELSDPEAAQTTPGSTHSSELAERG